ncbi:hypothetical protein HCU64_21910 [Methylobacterium sp. C25]|uniref:hypothetical protein n=1 Tax=Methylobacterium sp. C25 TaxID=2721622 RepID=UPI001F254A65|nr:hypothetical protein [Methylobacterium sp. C25]MCE4226406.1 hypothetical protein [Methylobacterium sp. C25]
MPPPPAKSDLWTPWKAPESRRVVEQGESVPEQIADLPPPALEPQSETSSPSSGTASTDPATSASPPKPADATASLPAKPEAVGSGEEDKVAGTESLVPNEKIKAADGYLSRGQITIARYIYEEAFKAGDVLGAIGMARSYDPAYLKSIRSRATGQTEKAALWYRRAAEMTARASKSP